jgi:hypothetical protein
MMATVGTIIIAIIGYGAALLCGYATVVSIIKAVRGPTAVDRREDLVAAFVGTALTLFIAVITRGLVGSL